MGFSHKRKEGDFLFFLQKGGGVREGRDKKAFDLAPPVAASAWNRNSPLSFFC